MGREKNIKNTFLLVIWSFIKILLRKACVCSVDEQEPAVVLGAGLATRKLSILTVFYCFGERWREDEDEVFES